MLWNGLDYRVEWGKMDIELRWTVNAKLKKAFIPIIHLTP